MLCQTAIGCVRSGHVGGVNNKKYLHENEIHFPKELVSLYCVTPPTWPLRTHSIECGDASVKRTSIKEYT